MRTRSLKCAALLAAVVVVQVGLGGPAWAAKGKTLREAYVGGTITAGLGKVVAFCRADDLNPTGKNVGRVCFTGLTSGKEYKVSVLDVSGQDVPFWYVWDHYVGHIDGYGCKTVTLTMPFNASSLEIYLDGPIGPWSEPYPDCFHNGLPGSPVAATKGEVTLTTPSVHRRR